MLLAAFPQGCLTVPVRNAFPHWFAADLGKYVGLCKARQVGREGQRAVPRHLARKKRGIWKMSIHIDSLLTRTIQRSHGPREATSLVDHQQSLCKEPGQGQSLKEGSLTPT